jgi:hypothetical protein
VYASQDLFTDIPPLPAIVQKEIGDGRLFRMDDPENILLKIPGSYVRAFQVPPNSMIWGTRWNLEMLFGHVAPFYNIPIIFHDPLALGSQRQQKLRGLIYALPWKARVPLLSAANVTLLLTADTLSVPGLSLVGEIPNWSDLQLYLYRNENAARRVEFVTNWESVQSDSAALAVIRQQDYDPRNVVVLQSPESQRWFPSFKKGSEKGFHETYPELQEKQRPHNLAFSKCPPAHITTLNSKSHAASYSVSNHCDGYLVFSESFYPGWEAIVDGEAVPILRANYAFSAIFLEAGEHNVERYYRPKSFLIGRSTSLLFCFLLLVAASIRRLRIK